MNRLVKIALLISLAFNMAFLIGYFSAPTSATPTELPDHTADLVQRELGLDMSQREKFLSLHSEAGARVREFHQASALVRQDLLAESAKPEPAIFQAAAKLAGVPPNEIFFVDDTLGHVEGAKAAGIDAVQYTSTPALVAELRARGVAFNH